jgi:hypothetical protein
MKTSTGADDAAQNIQVDGKISRKAKNAKAAAQKEQEEPVVDKEHAGIKQSVLNRFGFSSFSQLYADEELNTKGVSKET